MRLLTAEGRVVFGIAVLAMFSAGVAVGCKAPKPERPIVPEDFAVHPVTCVQSPHTSALVQCVGDVPIHLEGRRIRLISEPWDGGAP